ncbi:hypothetical protein WMF31_25600 [Sorangium sp. So ce1036]|uniref:hypothetical protein n=1 Tax=Sorangium sp. So ce1036 TaxID=3133328 RepID=UPI003F0AECFF
MPWRAGAAPPRVAVQLQYQRAPGAEHCPRERLLREELAQRLGYDPVEPEADVAIKALVFRGPDREMHATLDLHDAAGVVTWSRHLVVYNNDCRELVLNMALSLRVAIDPTLRVQPAPPSRPAPAPLPDAPAPPPDAPPEEPPRPAWPKLKAGLDGFVSHGILQETSAGPALSIALRYPSFSLGLEGRFDLPVTFRVDGTARVSTWLAAANVVPCAQVHRLFACGFVSFGSMSSSSPDLELTTEAPSFWLALGPRAGLEMPLSEQIGVQLYGDIVIRATPVILTHTSNGTERALWEAPSLGGRFGLRLVVNLSALRGAPAQRAALVRSTRAPR